MWDVLNSSRRSLGTRLIFFGQALSGTQLCDASSSNSFVFKKIYLYLNVTKHIRTLEMIFKKRINQSNNI